MRLFLDHNMSPETGAFLYGLGHDVTDTREHGMSRATDKEIMAFAQREGRMVVTFDSDFGNILEFPPGTYPGVIRLKVRPQTVEVLHPILEEFFGKVSEEHLKGALAIVENYRFRIRGKSGIIWAWIGGNQDVEYEPKTLNTD